MLKIGVTGNIGAGKSQVCKVFELLSIPIYYADERAKWLMQKGSQLSNDLIRMFGEEVYLEDGELNRKHIAGIVFDEREKLIELNALVHPAVAMDFESWALKQNAGYVVKEAALLFEAGSYKLLDFNILVVADVERRINRVMKRDQISREEVEKRIKHQMKQEDKIKLADHVIVNNGDTALVKEVLLLHNKFTEG